jgi:hypothetical protein
MYNALKKALLIFQLQRKSVGALAVCKTISHFIARVSSVDTCQQKEQYIHSKGVHFCPLHVTEGLLKEAAEKTSIV